MSEKIGMKKKREALAKMIGTDVDDSWASVELYRWQHGHLPGEAGREEKPLDIPVAMRAMATALYGDRSKMPSPMNCAEVLKMAAKIIEKSQTNENAGIA